MIKIPLMNIFLPLKWATLVALVLVGLSPNCLAKDLKFTVVSKVILEDVESTRQMKQLKVSGDGDIRVLAFKPEEQLFFYQKDGRFDRAVDLSKFLPAAAKDLFVVDFELSASGASHVVLQWKEEGKLKYGVLILDKDGEFLKLLAGNQSNLRDIALAPDGQIYVLGRLETETEDEFYIGQIRANDILFKKVRQRPLGKDYNLLLLAPYPGEIPDIMELLKEGFQLLRPSGDRAVAASNTQPFIQPLKGFRGHATSEVRIVGVQATQTKLIVSKTLSRVTKHWFLFERKRYYPTDPLIEVYDRQGALLQQVDSLRSVAKFMFLRGADLQGHLYFTGFDKKKAYTLYKVKLE